MDKRYQVFVSSTYDDLREERTQVMQALLELDCIPSGMELFPAANEDQWTLIKEVIDDCDYYAVIIGGRYGSLHPSGKSYTQMEYEYALSKGKPTIAFLHQDPGKIPSGKSEPTEDGKKKLDEFRRLAQSKTVKYWSSPEDLGSKVSRSVAQLIKRHPAIGWVRANEAARVADQEILALRREIDELKGKLTKSTKQAPEGSEQLAQGSDEYEMDFDVRLNDPWEDAYWVQTYYVLATWDEIFTSIAPHLIERASEERMSEIIVEFCKPEIEKLVEDDTSMEIEKEVKERLEISSISLKTSDLKTIVVQLRGLGLIVRDERKPKDISTYWALTPLGDQIMTQLVAIRKGKGKAKTPVQEESKAKAAEATLQNASE